MSLLELEHVSLRRREQGRERLVLDDVSLHVRAGEFVMVWGTRRSGRTTLLRLAAGFLQPDNGTVRFDGRAANSPSVLGPGIGFVHRTFRSGEEHRVLEQVAAGALANGTGMREALEHARRALDLAGAEDCAALQLSELRGGELVRVALARALVLAPSLIVVDDPVAAVELTERDGVLALLRSLAGQGTAVLACTSDPAELAGAHRALTLSDGQLRGESVPELAPVVALRRAGM